MAGWATTRARPSPWRWPSTPPPDSGRTVMAEIRLPAGTPVEVRNRFDGAWVPGFEVAAVQPDGDQRRVHHPPHGALHCLRIVNRQHLSRVRTNERPKRAATSASSAGGWTPTLDTNAEMASRSMARRGPASVVRKGRKVPGS